MVQTITAKVKRPFLVRSVSLCTRRVENQVLNKNLNFSSVHERLYQAVKKCVFCIQIESKSGLMSKSTLALATNVSTCTCKNTTKTRAFSLDTATRNTKHSQAQVKQLKKSMTKNRISNFKPNESIVRLPKQTKFQNLIVQNEKLDDSLPNIDKKKHMIEIYKTPRVLNDNYKSDSKASFKTTLEKVPEMEETTTHQIKHQQQQQQPLTCRTNKTLATHNQTQQVEFILPPIGENDSSRNGGTGGILFDKAKSHQQIMKHYNSKMKRKDSGIADLDQLSHNGSENEYYNVVAIIHHNQHQHHLNQKQEESNTSVGATAALKKNATSSTLNSYGQSSSQSKPTTTTTTTSGYGSLKIKHRTLQRQITHLTMLEPSQPPPPPPPPVPLTRTDTILQRKSSPRRQLLVEKLDTTRNYRPIPKPRNANLNAPMQLRSRSLQRQTTFVNESTTKRNMTISLQNNQTNLVAMNGSKLAKSTINLMSSSARPSTTTNNGSSRLESTTPDLINQRTLENYLNAFNLSKLETQKSRDEMAQRVHTWLSDLIYLNDLSSLRPPSIESTSSGGGGCVTSKHEHLASLASQSHNHYGDAFDQLSDFDSYDEQIQEFNRVLDKTFCFVHND